MYNFYVLLPKYEENNDFKKFYKDNNFVSDLNRLIDEKKLSIYKIEDIGEYLKVIKKNDKCSKGIVSDWSDTFMFEKELSINESVMKFMYKYVENDYSFFICTIIKEKFLVEYAQNDMELYYKNKKIYPSFPEYTNYIMCVGDRISKRFFIDKLQNFYDVKMLLDDNIYNLVEYYDPILKINEKNIPKFALYINGENRNDIEPKIKFYIMIKLLEHKIKKHKIEIYKIALSLNYNLNSLFDELFKKRIYFNKKNIFEKIQNYYDFMVKKKFMIKSNEDLSKETNVSLEIKKRELYRSKYFKYKNDYIEAKYPNQLIKRHQIIQKKVNDKTVPYSRASTIIVEQNYINKKNIKGPTIILFRDTKWNTYIEPGGRIDKKENNKRSFDEILIKTAQRELREETLNTFNISESVFKNLLYIDNFDKIRNKFGRAFFLCLKENSFNEEVYHHNKKIIFNQEITSNNIVWRETNDVNRFFISDLQKCLKNYEGFDVICNDVNGNENTIYYNTASIISDGFKQNIFGDVFKNCIHINKIKWEGDESFLNDTMTYVND